eukprot:jgi/Mesvir1/16184/Mv08449-RA.1
MIEVAPSCPLRGGRRVCVPGCFVDTRWLLLTNGPLCWTWVSRASPLALAALLRDWWRLPPQRIPRRGAHAPPWSTTWREHVQFYIIQLLEKDGGGSYYVWTRWGRVGADGQWDLHGRDKIPFRAKPREGMLSIAPFVDLASAMETFQSKFHDKTRNHWENRDQFQKVPGKYHLLEMDYERNTELEERRAKMVEKAKAEVAPSKLEASVQHLINLICNVDMMQREMMEIGYDAKKLPLGSLSTKTIKEGLAILQRIGSVLEKASRENLVELTSQYYTLIPHDFGRRNIKDQVIRTSPHLKRELELLDSLANIEIAFQILDQPVESKVNPVDAHYERLRCEVSPVTDAAELDMIRKYVANTKGRTHEFTLAVDQVYRVNREGENERFAPSRDLGNRMLLWHGSRLSNWMGILSSGLRVAPPEAPVTGYMFGKGIYFADMVTKSGQYCFTTPKQNKGLLLLSEVALGSMNEKLRHDYKGDKLPPGKHSVKGVGRAFPDPACDLLLPEGTRVPLGPAKEVENHEGELQYNEYIVYSEAQVRMRYLVECSFTHNFC